MILEIKKYPNPILKKKSQKVKKITSEIENLGQEMIKIMAKNEGVGLAAPQIGKLKRIIIVQPIKEGFSEGRDKKKPQVFINPKIIKKSKKTIIDEEGCLSFPGLFLKIKRAKEIEIEALDEKGEKINYKAQGLPARIIQHEIDHLDGILFIERISFWQKFKMRKKLNFDT